MERLNQILVLGCLMLITNSYSQVGIGTTSPDASSVLDVVATDKGLLIPRVSLANISTTMLDGSNSAATGLLIYNTNASVIGGNGVGYYYFNGTQWEKLVSSSVNDDHDFYREGTTNAPSNINDDIFRHGNVAIGKNFANYPIDVRSSSANRGVNIELNGSDNDPRYGMYSTISNTGNNWHFGTVNDLSGTGNGYQIGIKNTISNDGFGIHFGTQNLLGGAGNGIKYGTWNDIVNTGNSPHIGTSNNLSGIGTGTQYGTRNNILNTGDGDHYGTYSSIDSSGSGNHYGSYNEINGIGNGIQYGTRNVIFNTGNSAHVGTSNSLTGSGTGFKYGTRNIISDTAGGTHFGIYSSALKAGSYAGYFLGNVSVGTAIANTYILPSSRGTLNQIMQTDAVGNVSWVEASTVGTDNQNISGSSLAGTTLTIGIEDGTSETVDLSSLQDGIGTDNQTLSYNATTGQLDIEDGNSVNLATGDITDVNGGNGLIGTTTTGAATLDVVANNGLTTNADDIILGGTLNQSTTITQGANNMIFDLDATGDFSVQVNGTNHFEVRNSGLTYFGDDTYWNDGSTTGTTLARLYDGGTGDDGVFEIYKDGTLQHQLNSNGTSVINELGQDFDFRIEGDSEPNLFYTDAGEDRIGVLTNTPGFDIHLVQSNTFIGGTGGMGFSAGANNWKIYHSGLHFSFDENGTRRAYITGGTGAYVVTSDKRLKKDISEIEDSMLSKLNILKVYRYLYKDQKISDKKTLGFMAQDVQELFPELVETGENDFLGLNYAGFGVVAVRAIQEQQELIDVQQKQIEALQKSEAETSLLLNSLLQRIENLENQD